MKPKILCIDDEPNMLASMQLTLRRDFEVVVATSGEQGLQILEATPDIVTIVTDMRMPKMNGAAVLTRARELRPDVTRILLTGQADTQSTISAINDGQVFRYLTKPCQPEILISSLKSAVEHNRLVTAERVLVQETLRGAVAALVDVLALASPMVFGRANRVKKRAVQLAEQVKLPDPWQLDLAVSLSHLGYMSLAPETLERLYSGETLSDEETKQVAKMPAMTEQILSHIPRLETIREILTVAARQTAWSGVSGEGAIEMAGAILRLASDADAVETSGVQGVKMVKLLRQRGGHAPKLIDALETLVGRATSSLYIVELPLAGLKPGMVLADDVFLNGALLVSRGFTVTGTFLERTKHFAKGAVKEPLRILMSADGAADLRTGTTSK
ncbi:MAG TPA: response regulator [Kofleriaceae bacterium]